MGRANPHKKKSKNQKKGDIRPYKGGPFMTKNLGGKQKKSPDGGFHPCDEKSEGWLRAAVETNKQGRKGEKTNTV